MRDNVVEIKGIDYQTIDEIIINKSVNEHGSAIIKCTTDMTSLKDIISSEDGMSWVSIMIGEAEGGKATDAIFAGVVDTISLEACDSLEKIKKVTVKLIGGSYLLDVKKEIYTYQKDDTKISEIKNKIKENAKKNFTKLNLKINNGKDIKDSDKPESEMLVQYLETDYEFLKRCASINNQPLITVIDSNDGINVDVNIGLMSGGKSGSIDTKLYKEEKNLKAALIAEKLGIENVNEKDYQMVEVRTREYFDLGSQVDIDGKSLYVYSSESKFGIKTKEDKALWIDSNDTSEHTSSVFYHIYKLAEEKRFKVPRQYNEKMIGVSLNAKVSKVNKDKLEIECECDGKKSNTPKEFPYATVYSSKDGTGWYCMPEVDDEIRLYLPTEDEEDAYVISAVHLEGAELRNNPDVKFIMNKYKKEVRFEEKTIKITNNNGMEIVIDDDKGISITSDKDISISGSKDVTLLSKSGEMHFSGEKEISLKQGASAYVEMKNGIKFKGTKINM